MSIQIEKSDEIEKAKVLLESEHDEVLKVGRILRIYINSIESKIDYSKSRGVEVKLNIIIMPNKDGSYKTIDPNEQYVLVEL